MKTDAVYKRAFNDALDLIAALPPGAGLPSENTFARQLQVSRTTVRKILVELEARGLISLKTRDIRTEVVDGASQRFPDSETVALSAQVEHRFMEWMHRVDPRPGTVINELELARQFNVATTVIREFLNRFQRFGIIEKRPNAGWLFKGFTPSFALELFEIREMFELRSAKAFGALPKTSPLWRKMEALQAEHLEMLANIDDRFHAFSDLDNRFHRLINSASPNQFIDNFYDLISLIFHFHYQWKKHDERQRNEVAVREHLAYMEALFSGNPTMIELGCRAHLASARQTLIRATSQSRP